MITIKVMFGGREDLLWARLYFEFKSIDLDIVLLLHSNVLLFHSNVLLFHSNVLLFHSNVLLFHSNVLLFHSNVLLFHSNALLFHGNVLLFQLLIDLRINAINALQLRSRMQRSTSFICLFIYVYRTSFCTLPPSYACSNCS